MIYNDTDAVKFYRMFEARRQCSKLKVSEAEVKQLFTTINYINGLEKGVSIVRDNYFTSMYEIPNVFGNLIVPAEVTFNSDVMAANLINTGYSEMKEEYDDNNISILSPEEFNNIWIALMGAIRANSDGYTNTDVLRKPTLLSDVIDRACNVETLECRDGGKYIPIYLKYNFYRERYYNIDAHEMFKDYVDEVTLKMVIK